MLKEVYSSDPPEYLLTSVYGIPSGSGLSALYNEYLVTPPRGTYAESIVGTQALIVNYGQVPETTYTLHATVDQIYWPSWGLYTYTFDGESGDFLSRGDSPFLQNQRILQGRDRTLWATATTAFQVDELDPLTLDSINTIDASFFAGSFGVWAMVGDRQTNRFVGVASTPGLEYLAIYNLTTGALLHYLFLSGQPTHISLVDTRFCYVMLDNGLLNLVDYQNGNVAATYKPPLFDPVAMAFDQVRQRLIIYDDAEDAEDGAAQGVLKGYIAVPGAVGLMTPIPLLAPRVGRRVPILTRVYGDVGEPVSGGRVAITASENADVVGPVMITDATGYATGQVVPLDTDDVTVDLELSV